MKQRSEGTKPVQHIRVDEERAGQRVDNFLLNVLKGVPKSHVYRILRRGEVRVNKRRVKPVYRLQLDDLVRPGHQSKRARVEVPAARGRIDDGRGLGDVGERLVRRDPRPCFVPLPLRWS